jgi:hypothetical protein
MNKQCLNKHEKINNRRVNKRFEGFKNKKQVLSSPEKKTARSYPRF